MNSIDHKKRLSEHESTIYNRRTSGAFNLSNLDSPEGIFHDFHMIGKGSYGEVYKAKIIGSEKVVAIKTMDFMDDEETVRNEINVLMKIDHPNIISYFSTFLYQESVWIVMEYCLLNISSFFKKIKILINTQQFKLVTEKIVYYFTHEIASGLDYMHKSWTIHRDIKGQNILLTPDGSVKICDLGIAKQSKNKGKYSTIIGTPYWMAPDITKLSNGSFGNKKSYSYSVDIFSLAATIYEMIYLNPPRSTQNVNYILNSGHKMKNAIQLKYNDPESLIKIRPEAIKITNQMFSHEPDHRPSANIVKIAFAAWFDYAESKNDTSEILLDPMLNSAGSKARVNLNINNLSKDAESRPNMNEARRLENQIKKKELKNDTIIEEEISQLSLKTPSPAKQDPADKTIQCSIKTPERKITQNLDFPLYRIKNGKHSKAVASFNVEKIIYYSVDCKVYEFNRETKQEQLVFQDDCYIQQLCCTAKKLVVISKFNYQKREDSYFKIISIDISNENKGREILMANASSVIVTKQIDGSYIIGGYKETSGALSIFTENNKSDAIIKDQEVFIDHVIENKNMLKKSLIIKINQVTSIYLVNDSIVKYLEIRKGWVSDEEIFFDPLHFLRRAGFDSVANLQCSVIGGSKISNSQNSSTSPLLVRIIITYKELSFVLSPSKLVTGFFYHSQSTPIYILLDKNAFAYKNVNGNLAIKNFSSDSIIAQTNFNFNKLDPSSIKYNFKGEFPNCLLFSLLFPIQENENQYNLSNFLLYTNDY